MNQPKPVAQSFGFVEPMRGDKDSFTCRSQMFDKVKNRAQDHEQFAEKHRESIQVEGPNELEGGATRWMVSIKAPPLQAAVFKRALVSVTHQVMNEEGFAPDALGRICN